MFYYAAMGTRSRVYTPPGPPPDERLRHCWVRARVGKSERWCPGLIHEWRPANGGGWAARVVYVPDPRRAESVEAWFAQALLRPVESQSPSQANRAVARYKAAGGTTY